MGDERAERKPPGGGGGGERSEPGGVGEGTKKRARRVNAGPAIVVSYFYCFT